MGSSSALPSGTVTFLFTDIEGSTQSAALLGDERYAELLEIHRGVLRGAFVAHKGVEVGTEGDAFFVAFELAQDAVAAAVQGQAALESHAWPGEARLRVRMGLHTGEALVRGRDYVGHNVHKAKRICDAGHGGQILLSATTADLVRSKAALRDLGPHRLKDLGEPQVVYQVIDDSLPSEFPRLRSLEAFTHNLPLQRSTFVGRERELVEIRDLLATNRLVTLTGVGGCGKTRLALQVGAESLDTFPNGVFFADLAAVSDPTLVAQTVAGAVGMLSGTAPGATGSIEAALLGFLSDRVCLLVLDNCEHLLDACAEFVDRVLARCPKVTILATSREALDVDGEQSWRVPSLTIPEDASEAQSSEAVSLFKARAVAARPDFELTPANIDVVADICRRLDGIPLAIEFAASRVSHLPPQEIADRLKDMFRLLTGGRRRVQRQQTLAAALDWSYELLSDDERSLLRRLAVFSGTFGIPAVEGICSGGDVDQGAVVDLLGSLVAKSLVTAEARKGVARYRFLETVRLYASEKLRESGEADEIRGRHRDWYLAWADAMSWEAVLGSSSAGGTPAADVHDEHANVRGALEWSEAEGRLDLAVRTAARSFDLWFWGGRFEEGLQWLSKARPEDLDLSVEDRVGALCVMANLALVLGDREMAATLADRAVQAAGDVLCAPLVRALTLRGENRAVASEWSSDPALAEAAREDHRAAIRTTLELGLSDAWRGSALVIQGHSELVLGDAHAALASHEAGYAMLPGEANSGVYLSADAHLVGDHDRASRVSRPFLSRFAGSWIDTRDLSNWWRSRVTSPAVALAGAGEVDTGHQLLADNIEEARRSGRPGSVEEMMVGFAAIAHLSGDPARASRLLAWVRSRTFEVGIIIPSQTAYALYRHYVRLVRAALDTDEVRRYRDEGQGMSEDEAVALALRTQ